MNERAEKFNRLVLGLRAGLPADLALLRYVAEFAKLLDVEFHSLLIADKRLTVAADLPFTREIQHLQGQWRALQAEDLQRDLEACMAMARRQISDIARAAGIAPRLNIGMSETMREILSTAGAHDILVIAEAAAPSERAMHPIEDLASLALSGPASVLLIPSPIARRRGAVLAVAGGPDDPALRWASAIAQAAHEPMHIMAPDEKSKHGTRFAGRMKESLIVMSRTKAGDLDPLLYALSQRVPVLALEAPAAKESR